MAIHKCLYLLVPCLQSRQKKAEPFRLFMLFDDILGRFRMPCFRLAPFPVSCVSYVWKIPILCLYTGRFPPRVGVSATACLSLLCAIRIGRTTGVAAAASLLPTRSARLLLDWIGPLAALLSGNIADTANKRATGAAAHLFVAQRAAVVPVLRGFTTREVFRRSASSHPGSSGWTGRSGAVTGCTGVAHHHDSP